MKIRFWGVALGGLLSLSCAGSSKPAATPEDQAEARTAAEKHFTFAPVAGTKYAHVMRRLDEVTFEGHPVRFAEEWEITWHVEIKPETNLFVFRNTLAGLKLAVNGAAVLQGSEVAGSQAYFDLAFDGEGNVVDVRNTQSLTDAISAVVRPENKGLVTQMFSAENLRFLFFVRAQERGRELVGQNAAVGSTWSYQFEASPGVEAAETKLTVKEAVPCGAAHCVKVVRETKLNDNMVWMGAAARVEQFVADRGADPKSIVLKSAEVRLVDELVLVPERMEFHGATFDQDARLSVTNGAEELSVRFRTTRSSEYKY
ncbi:MAG TPA: hypothetical protein VN764_12455 [Polyangiaceae bacterium]|nr:hypothetical protein [Polyangiaceae bacterium]